MEASFIPYHAETCLPARSVLVLAPHADDEVFGCGGAIARHVAAGVPLRIVIASDGAFRLEGGSREQCIAEREAESTAAAAILGASTPLFWRLPDRGLCTDAALVERIISAVSDSGADLIYAPALSEAHPDHRALAQAAVLAVDVLASGRGNAPALAMYEIGMNLHANRLLDITPVWERKQAAMQCFSSQLRWQRYDEHVTGLNRYRSYTLGAETRYAEAYALYAPAELSACAASLRAYGDATLPPWAPADPVLQAQLQAGEERERALAAELVRLYASSSWRWTAPLRRLMQGWRRRNG